jgi:hypothetical protein
MERQPNFGIKENEDSLCQDLNQVNDLIDRYLKQVRALEEARAGLAAAKTDRERALWVKEVQIQEAAVAEAKPGYDRAVKCTTSA